MGENEYFDVELTENWDPAQLQEILNANLHEGFDVVEVKRIDADTPTLEALIERFDYRISFDTKTLQAHIGALSELEDTLSKRLANGGWVIERTIKRKRKTIDAAEFVTGWTFAANNGNTDWNLTLTSRDGRCVKPRELVESLLGDYPDHTVISRVRMGRMVGDRFVTPLEDQPA
jgi:radical SAM-linked protein